MANALKELYNAIQQLFKPVKKTVRVGTKKVEKTVDKSVKKMESGLPEFKEKASRHSELGLPIGKHGTKI